MVTSLVVLDSEGERLPARLISWEGALGMKLPWIYCDGGEGRGGHGHCVPVRGPLRRRARCDALGMPRHVAGLGWVGAVLFRLGANGGGPGGR
jgi:hypothetical protein